MNLKNITVYSTSLGHRPPNKSKSCFSIHIGKWTKFGQRPAWGGSDYKEGISKVATRFLNKTFFNI